MRLGTLQLMLLAASLTLGLIGARGAAQGQRDPLAATPDATVNLMTREGVQHVNGQWRYSDVKIVEVDYRGKRTYDYTPPASQVAKPDFDDSAWELLDPTTLGRPRAVGKVCFAWYRITLTVPEKVGSFDTAGGTLVFDTIVDDYGEIWVDGKLNYDAGQKGGAVVAGFNAPNRLVVGRDVKPGEKITLAVFAINGPISASPGNSIFLRQAKLDFYKK